MKKYILAVLIAFVTVSVFAQGPMKGPLDKNVYLVETFKEGKKKPLDPDQLKFLTGKFKSKVFSESYGFKKTVPYTIASVDSSNAEAWVYVWTASSINDIKDTLKWTGTITGEDIEGTADLIDDKGKHKWTYTFSGKLKPGPGKKK